MGGTARWVATDPVPLVRIEEGVEVVGNPQWASSWTEGIRGGYVPELLWQLAGAPPGTPVRAARDDNRSAILPEQTVAFDGTDYLVAVKGSGAEFDAYEPKRLTGPRLREICHDPSLRERIPATEGGAAAFIVGERWWGNAPYGGQAGDSALLALLASQRADRNQIAGFYLCPVIAAVRLPEAIARTASQFYWYRQYEGGYWQEIRLMPSNVRLYFHSAVTLGVDAGRVFSLFGLSDLSTCERFLERLVRSTLAAITLFARSLRHDPLTGRYTGLDYDEVYLDKDSVVAPDGTLHFADLEGVEPVFATEAAAIAERIENQYYHSLYEATYAFEAISQETFRCLGLSAVGADRRRWALEILDRACRPDPYLSVEAEGDGRTLIVHPAVEVPGLDLRLTWSTEA